ncbi:PH domain-containing protein [Paenibacillus sp. NPDC058071]|uniref:PH domain-containing protein n=1 Tax=Paenibacillus sp. NPDC058071 TaxID=3346326 RepID=UPI0036D97565
MDRLLTKKLNEDYIKVYRITSFLTHVVLYAIVIGYAALAQSRDWTLLPAWIGLAVVTASAVWFTLLVPTWKYRFFRYELFEEELEVQSGFLFLKNVLVPMVRVQHVELESGPLMRKFDLASVKVVTAATTHTISGLKQPDAQRLKRTIGQLAKVDEQDE